VANKYDFCPKIKKCIYRDDKVIIEMDKVDGDTLYEKYLDNPKDIPDHIWSQIRNIISTLFYEEGIEYVDISPYNFIVKNDKVYIIDFGHAYWCNEDCLIKNWFLRDFLLAEVNGFNPDFR
jgi:RIO-like serine/threonine protein kinase